MMRKWLACVWGLVLVFTSTAVAEAPTVTSVIPVTLETPAGSLSYPRLDGHPDALVQVLVNQGLLTDLNVQKLLDELNGLHGDEKVFRADYEATLMGDVLSVVMTHKGEEKARSYNQTYAAATYDLVTGQKITLDQLFVDVEAAVAAMEAICETKVTENISSYLENGEVTPLPRENFYLTADGITFYYPEEQFVYFSGYCGSVSFFYYELQEYLNLSEGSVLAQMGADQYIAIAEDSAQQIAQVVEAGNLPGVAPKLGDLLLSWLDDYRLLCDPDYYPGGRFFQTEAGEMRNIWLLTDALTDSYDTNAVLGIRADRINLYGLQPEITPRDEWLALLGEPQTSVQLNDSAAMDYSLPAGISDYYTFGEHQLRLHCNEEGILVSVWLLD